MNWAKTFVLALVLSSAPVSIAWADDSEAKKNEALVLYEKGRELMKFGEWEKAEQEYTASLQTFSMPRTRGMLGFVQIQRGNYLDGVRNLEWFFQEDTTVDAEKREQVRSQYVLAKKNVATIKLKVDPIDAVVSIDGAAIPSNQLHWPHYVGAGTHVIEAKKDGFGLERQSVTVAIGMESPVELKLFAVSKPGEGPKEKPVIGPKPVKMSPLVLAAWIGGGVFGAVAIGTGIGAGRTYGPMEDAWYKRGCGAKCESMYNADKSTLGALSTTALMTGLLSAGAFGYALYGTFMPSRSRTTSLNVVPTGNGLLFLGHW